MSEPRIIKKYPNRRLYDTAISSYITLADVKRLVLEGVAFQVIDAKTHEDLTRTILLQIISEEEEGGEPIFSSHLLAQLIRAYGGNMQSMLTSYLEKSLELWGEQQRAFHEHTRELMEKNPMNIMTQIAERNLTMWRQMSGFDSWDAFGSPGSATGERGNERRSGRASSSGGKEAASGGNSESGQDSSSQPPSAQGSSAEYSAAKKRSSSPSKSASKSTNDSSSKK